MMETRMKLMALQLQLMRVRLKLLALRIKAYQWYRNIDELKGQLRSIDER